MIRLMLVKKEVPILGSSRQGIYRIRDRVFDFWYRFVFPRRQEIETGHADVPLPDMNPFFGRQFEAFVRDEYAGTVLPGYRTGHWWYNEDEIDLVAVNEDSSSVVFGECKWGNVSHSEAKKLITRLKTKSRLVRAGKYRHRKYALFCAGTVEGKDRLRDEGYLVFDGADLEEF
jgi:AAA+ ATPase superfamily predicted ATPase